MPATLRRVAQHACFGSCQLGCTPDFKPFPGMADGLPEEVLGRLQRTGQICGQTNGGKIK